MASNAGRLDIYNMALGWVGTRTVASPNENCAEARACELYWDRARRSALEDFPYSFAQQRVKLALKELPPVYEGEWAYCYGLPNRCLKVRDVHGGRERGRKMPFRLQLEGKEVIILSDVPEAIAEITRDVEDISLWDELFVMAMARKLATLIHTPLMKNQPQKQQELEQLYAMAIPRATGQDASESVGREHMDSWLTARGTW